MTSALDQMKCCILTVSRADDAQIDHFELKLNYTLSLLHLQLSQLLDCVELPTCCNINFYKYTNGMTVTTTYYCHIASNPDPGTSLKIMNILWQ